MATEANADGRRAWVQAGRVRLWLAKRRCGRGWARSVHVHE